MTTLPSSAIASFQQALESSTPNRASGRDMVAMQSDEDNPCAPHNIVADIELGLRRESDAMPTADGKAAGISPCTHDVRKKAVKMYQQGNTNGSGGNGGPSASGGGGGLPGTPGGQGGPQLVPPPTGVPQDPDTMSVQGMARFLMSHWDKALGALVRFFTKNPDKLVEIGEKAGLVQGSKLDVPCAQKLAEHLPEDFLEAIEYFQCGLNTSIGLSKKAQLVYMALHIANSGYKVQTNQCGCCK